MFISKNIAFNIILPICYVLSVIYYLLYRNIPYNITVLLSSGYTNYIKQKNIFRNFIVCKKKNIYIINVMGKRVSR